MSVSSLPGRKKGGEERERREEKEEERKEKGEEMEGEGRREYLLLSLCFPPPSSELVSLQRRCELQSREMNHVKRLARHILDQRSEVEQFFLESLTFVKKKIATNR